MQATITTVMVDINDELGAKIGADSLVKLAPFTDNLNKKNHFFKDIYRK